MLCSLSITGFCGILRLLEIKTTYRVVASNKIASGRLSVVQQTIHNKSKTVIN
jgi:hypothetical protein